VFAVASHQNKKRDLPAQRFGAYRAERVKQTFRTDKACFRDPKRAPVRRGSLGLEVFDESPTSVSRAPEPVAACEQKIHPRGEMGERFLQVHHRLRIDRTETLVDSDSLRMAWPVLFLRR